MEERKDDTKQIHRHMLCLCLSGGSKRQRLSWVSKKLTAAVPLVQFGLFNIQYNSHVILVYLVQYDHLPSDCSV